MNNPHQQESWVDRFENEFDYLYEKDEVKAFISTERQRAFDAGYAKGSLDEKRMRLYGKDKDAYPENFLGIKEVKKTERQRVLDEVKKLLIREGYLRGLEPIERIKPGHGGCCTCQICGQFYEDCVCEHNHLLQALKEMEDKTL